MRFFAFLVVAILPVSTASGDEPKVDAKELAKKFAGTWLTTNASGTVFGRDEERIVIEGQKLLMFSQGKLLREFTFELDPSAGTTRIDLTYTGKDEKPNTSAGIIELKGETLRICVANFGGDRPSEFEARTMARSLVYLKRKKE